MAKETKTSETKNIPTTSRWDIFIASNAKNRTFIEQLGFTGQNFTQKDLGTICGFFGIGDLSSANAHIVHFLTAEFKKEYFARPKRSRGESFIAALHHTNRALAELAKNDIISWINVLDSALCAYDENSIHFSVTGHGYIFLLRDGELMHISEGIAPAEDEVNPLKTFIDTAHGDLQVGDRVIITSREILDLIPIEELTYNAKRFSAEEFAQFLTTALTNESAIASTQFIDITQKCTATITKTESLATNTSEENAEIQLPENAFSAESYHAKKVNETEKIEDAPEEEITTPARRPGVMRSPHKKATEPVGKKVKRGDAYVDQRTGHIYINGDNQGTSANPLIDRSHDVLKDIVYITRETIGKYTRRTTLFVASTKERLDDAGLLEKLQTAAIIKKPQQDDDLLDIEETEEYEGVEEYESQEKSVEKTEAQREVDTTPQATTSTESTDITYESATLTSKAKGYVDTAKEKARATHANLPDTWEKMQTSAQTWTASAKANTKNLYKKSEGVLGDHIKNIKDRKVKKETVQEAPEIYSNIAQMTEMSDEKRTDLLSSLYGGTEEAEKSAKWEKKELSESRTLRFLDGLQTKWNEAQSTTQPLRERWYDVTAGTKIIAAVIAVCVGLVIIMNANASKQAREKAEAEREQKEQEALMEELRETAEAAEEKDPSISQGSNSLEQTAITNSIADPVILSARTVAETIVPYDGDLYLPANTSVRHISAGTETEIPLPANSGNVTHTAAMPDVDLIFLITDTNRLFALNPDTRVILPQTIQLASGTLDHTQIIDILAYRQRLYITTADNVITRYSRAVGSFNQGAAWVTDGTSLTGITDVAIDGRVYAAVAGSILTFASGIRDTGTAEAALSRNTDIQADLLSTTDTQDNLWILDKKASAIHKVDKSSFTVTETYTHTDVQKATDFTVNESTNTATLVDGTKATTLTLTNNQ